jgi:hypothetical protein
MPEDYFTTATVESPAFVGANTTSPPTYIQQMYQASHIPTPTQHIPQSSSNIMPTPPTTTADKHEQGGKKEEGNFTINSRFIIGAAELHVC